MQVSTRSARSGLMATVALVVCYPFLCGQSGCFNFGPGVVEDLTPSGQTAGNPTGNTPPTFVFTDPVADISRELGDVIPISWIVSDPDSNASITILLDPDGVFGNGNERVIVPILLEDSSPMTFNLDTAALNIPAGSYRIIARVNDGVNPEVLVVAGGRILLFGPGLLPGNASPSVVVGSPATNIALSHMDTLTITVCGRDRDNGANGQNPDILVLLDQDNDPMNDINLMAGGETLLNSICTGGLPREVQNTIVLACLKDNDCNPAIPEQYQTVSIQVDVGLIPPTLTGEPYRVRATMWDHTNAQVSAYATGTVSITSLASGLLDLGNVGRSISGTRFYGFDAGGRVGATAASLGDFDGDGADDFIIVSRFGRPFERGNIGSAFLVYGQPNAKFGSEINLNGIGTTYRGAGFAMGVGARVGSITGTQGIASVARIADLNGDGRPEILFGMPYVEQMYDYFDDDPEDDDDICYRDDLPNPLSSSDPSNDDLGNFDRREAGTCSNDGDMERITPIDQGYVIYVRSDNTLEGNIIDLPLVGMHDPEGVVNDEGAAFSGASAPTGARFRGGWWHVRDLDRTGTAPYAIIPDNEFGMTVAAMPDLSNGFIAPQRDGREELLISAPSAFKTRGAVSLVFGQEFASFSSQPVSSLPNGPRGGNGWPVFREIIGAAIGDHLGFAGPAGDMNLDGHQDILLGAYGADRDGITDGGIVYIIFGRLDFADIDLATMNPPRVEIRGTNPGDQFGRMQSLIGDVNQDGIADICFASETADGPGGVDSGFIGIVFGGQRLTGENIFTVNQVGTAQLPGTKIYGSQPNGRAGATIANAGDFNGDGIDDLLITAPGELHIVDGQMRRGAAYLIFGGPHLSNASVSLSQIGTPQLPGMLIVSPYAAGSADEAPIDSAVGAGDVNADGFADILIGVSQADFVNPLEPGQRRVDAGEMYLIYGSNTGTNTLP